MNYGSNNRQITVNYPGALTDDGMGGFTEGAGTTATKWARVKQLSMSQKLQYGIEVSYSAYEFGFNYLSVTDVTDNCTITYDGKEFTIKDIADLKESHRETVIIGMVQTT